MLRRAEPVLRSDFKPYSAKGLTGIILASLL